MRHRAPTAVCFVPMSRDKKLGNKERKTAFLCKSLRNLGYAKSERRN